MSEAFLVRIDDAGVLKPLLIVTHKIHRVGSKGDDHAEVHRARNRTVVGMKSEAVGAITAIETNDRASPKLIGRENWRTNARRRETGH